MKQKLSITVNKELVEEVEKLVNSGKFRNKSHVLEYAFINFLRGNDDS